VEVTDLGSANGTYVNGVRVRAPTRIQDSDMLRIGRIQLKLAMPGEPDQSVATRERLAPLLGRGTPTVR
jgi:pSer/pThr/pTyr-binding forkhead associated (FHA) protein